LHIFGLPPLNQKDAASPLMTACFSEVADNLALFQALPATIPLNEKPGASDKQSAIEKKWREILATVPLERTGMKTPADDDNLNRFVWHEQMGWTTPYPREVAGSHGKGLKEIQLKIDEEEAED
jgi:hypothetical protein